MSDQITKEMIIRDVRDKYPGITAVFQAHGLPCAGCQVGSYESIAGGARTHSLDVDAILADLNKFAHDGTVPTSKARPTNMMAQKPARGDVKIQGIKHVVAVMSGKGGVGKSLVTGLLAVTLRRQGYRVGILDGDITGPSIPCMFGIPVKSLTQIAGQEKPNPPVSKGGIPIMSMNVLLDDPEAAVVWRGPMVSGAIRQFYTDMNWGDLDYLLVDLPPGTSDAPMTVLQQLPTDGVVLVSSPQGLATMVVSKAIQMAKKLEVPILGIVENMSYVELPDGARYELFGPSQGQRLVGLSGAPLLGQLPIDRTIAQLSDEGRIEEYDSEAYQTLARNFMTRLDQREYAVPALPRISSRSLAGAAQPLPKAGTLQTAPPAPAQPAAPTATVPRPTPDTQAANGYTEGGDKSGVLPRLGRFLKHEK